MSCTSFDANLSSSLNQGTVEVKLAKYVEKTILVGSPPTESLYHVIDGIQEINQEFPLTSALTSSLLCKTTQPTLQGDLKASFQNRTVLTDLAMCYFAP